ncbi:G-protein coupled receptor 183-like [Clarias gariepinus]
MNLTLDPTVAPLNLNTTPKPFNVFDGCETMVEGVLFDLTVQSFNFVIGLPANILVIAILIHNRNEPSTSDIFLGCLALMDGYFGLMVPISFLNLYYWKTKQGFLALQFSYGVKDTSGPLFFSCICLDRFIAVVFPIAFNQLKHIKYRIGLAVFVLCLTFGYASAKTIGGFHNFEKVFTAEILATFTWMLICNMSILWALKRSRGAGKDEMHPMKKKAFKMVLSILCIIIFNYLPLVALFPFEDHYTHVAFKCYIQPVGYAFMNISSSIQPLIYLSRLEKIPFLPKSLTEKLSCWKKTEQSPA